MEAASLPPHPIKRLVLYAALKRKELRMKTTNRLPWLGAVLLIAVALGLSACGGGSGASQPTAASAASGGATSADSTAAPAAGAASSTAAPVAADSGGAAGSSEIVISLNADPPKLDP